MTLGAMLEVSIHWQRSFVSLENQKLLFVETSALESTNVEAAFNKVLMGNSLINFVIYIYRYKMVYLFIKMWAKSVLICLKVFFYN